MNDKFYSNKEFTDIKERINAEIKRRGGFKWLNPLSEPKVGQDRTAPKTAGMDGTPIDVDDLTYTINNPSEGSWAPTKNIHYPKNGDNPAGAEPKFVSAEPNTSAAHFTVDEIRNFLVGLSNISEMDKFYGVDEEAGLAYRDPKAIEELLSRAENDKLHEKATTIKKPDPNGYLEYQKSKHYPRYDREAMFSIEDGIAMLPSGECDGDELESYDDLGPNNFFDDYGAPEGDGDFHPYNRALTPVVHRDVITQDDDRKTRRTVMIRGGRRSSDFGPNPRNPEEGDPYPSYPAYQGVATSCNNVCTGLCNVSCDDVCTESCTVTCTMRCGNACTASCGNVCTGCSSMCYNTCKTKCENSTGYACVKAGAKAVKLTDDGIEVQTVSCSGCSYSCQFYPNKKTTCWDSGCMGECFTSCNSGCMDSCNGTCMGDTEGSGSSCTASCTVDCDGSCEGVCSGECISTCFSSCTQQCTDNCEYFCSTDCGAGCASSCMQKCLGCTSTCDGSCSGGTDSKSCAGCGYRGGCTSTCASSCEDSCFNKGCRSMCGINDTNACDTNCRMNCSGSSCTAMCEDACTSQCSSCTNTCGSSCGQSCESSCSNSCDDKCSRMCTEACKNSCSNNCVQSCTEECGGCSSLCYSCVGMCIGVCSVKCESGCSSCANNCSFWCDTQCNQECFANCNTFCLSSCSSSCVSKVDTEAKKAERDSMKIMYRNEE